VTEQRCALDKVRKLERFALHLVIELFDEAQLPAKALDLPRAESKRENRNEADNKYGRR
jgi:hypothetical protein